MILGVAIPCYKYHIPVLKRCLDSIEAQTVKPALVVVSCSSTASHEIPSYTYSFPLTVVTTSDKLNAAQNRNRAADILVSKGCTVLSFIDCDDEMHPQRLESILYAWSRMPTCDICLHGYWWRKEVEQPWPTLDCKTIVYMPKYLIVRKPQLWAVLPHDYQARVHHAHVTVSKGVFERVRFPEQKDAERREDSLFCCNILELPGVESMYIDAPLSKYYMEGTTHDC
jgi:hypothetical protein